ncbi:OsmC family protein [candidate division KSB1 bacterium]|nr:OsmC family protein [candidate division KSB1 bacterium]
MNTTLKWFGKMGFIAKSDSNHAVVMDASTEVGGDNAGSRPMELLLQGLGGCTGMDVVSILQKKRVALTDLAIEIQAERAEEHPKVFTKIHLKFIFYGNGIKSKDVERAIELSETKYCSASAMFRHTAEIKTSYEIRESGLKS